MTELQHLLDQFRAGQIGPEILQENLYRWATRDGYRIQAALDALRREYQEGSLPPSLWFGLEARLLNIRSESDDPTRTARQDAAAPPDEEQTRLYDPRIPPAPPPDRTEAVLPQARAVSADITVVSAAGDADRTELLSPGSAEYAVRKPPTAASDRTEVLSSGTAAASGDATQVLGPSDRTEVLGTPESDHTEVLSSGTVSEDSTQVLSAEDSDHTEAVASPIPPESQGSRPPSGANTGFTSTRTDSRTIDPGLQMPNPEGPLQIGMVLKERFVLEEIIGGGGMGVVFKALDLRKREARDKEPYVALKVLNPEFRDNPISLIALQRETKRAQILSHPNIIKVFDFDRDGRHIFMSMEYLSGKPLSSLIRSLPETGMPFKKAWPIIKAMGDALAYSHSKDIIHSDFKPGNVFIDDKGDVRVLDFGIACAAGRPDKAADATLFDARALGALTPAYASPEMIQNRDPDPRDDIYALGIVAYELLTGKHPYGRVSADKALELRLQPKQPPGTTRRQWRGIQRAIALTQEQRTPSVDEFLADLQARSPMVYGLWAAAFAGIAVTGFNLYLGFSTPAEIPKAVAVQLNDEQRAKVKDLLDLAEVHFDVGYLTAPSGSNALWAYREVLKIDPYNKDAVQGMLKVADALEQSAWESFERGDQPDSLKKVMDGLEAVPDHKGLLALRGKLER